MYVRFIGGLGLLVLFAIHAMSKSLPQMMWACHIATLAIAIGALVESPKLIGAGTVFHAGSGIPTYVLGVLTTGENSITSVLIHTLPITIGLLELWRLGGLPRRSIVNAWLLYIGSMVASYFFTDPALNINLVHEVWPPMAGVFTQVWMSWVGNAAAALVLMAIADRAIRFGFDRLRRSQAPPPVGRAAPRSGAEA